MKATERDEKEIVLRGWRTRILNRFLTLATAGMSDLPKPIRVDELVEALSKSPRLAGLSCPDTALVPGFAPDELDEQPGVVQAH